MRKKLGLLLVISIMLVAVVGCGSSGSGKQYKIAISQIVEHPSLDATREGFLAALKDAGIVEGENLKLDYNNAQGDPNNNMTIAQKIAGEKYDLVLGIATLPAQALASQVKNSPVMFAAVTDPLDAKLIDNLEKPGGNVSGASDTNPEAITQLMDFIAGSFSDVKTVGVVLNQGEPNAVVMTNLAEKALEKHGIKIVKASVTNTSEVKQAAESLVGRADAIYITLDNTVVEAVSTVIQVANDNDIPFFSSDRDSVEKGAFATVGFKYYDHGYQAGQMALQVLKEGKKIGDLKVTVPEKLDLILNLKAAEEQGITVTDAMKEQVKDKETNILE
ncbi:ABC transporter substrate-binding protein [Paenibacillus motobuensis]|uniref:ABC transporter substrate-binding protein n=1 Tax=Paenibacillus TaxID=44249 RepID=UPI0020410BE8|nr:MULTISPECIES: ABC transporter substrate-binding protein [Paenibacillus]MCM3039935.1 ABC transporter substrate-binding protein [Paenibacillus lutimineralis]MCM3647039.1 ABC transporter substrate-binding protein [Paenibacillus motobuensis]